MDLKDRTIAVTGTAQELSRKMAEIVVGQGANLALPDIDHVKLRNTVRLCADSGGKAKDYAAHVTDESAVGTSISRAGNVGQTNYAAAKAGVAAMTVTRAISCGWANRPNGMFETILSSTFGGTLAVVRVSLNPGAMPATRMLYRASSLAHAVLFILQNDYYDGQILEIDGRLRL